MRYWKYSALALATLAFVLLEIAAYQLHGVFAIIAVYGWIAGGLFCTGWSLLQIGTVFYQDIRKRHLLVLVVFIVSLFVTFWNIQAVKHPSGEPTLEVAAGLNSLSVPDFNYTEHAFLGYPQRQYLIAAVPSLLFGRSIVSLKLGFAIPFFLALWVLYGGLRVYFSEKKYGYYVSSCTIAAIISFPYIIEFLHKYEQVIYPVSFTMHALGIYLMYLKKRSWGSIVSLAWMGGLLGTSYTPALGVWLLLVVVLSGQSYADMRHKRQRDAFIVACCVLIVAVYGALSFLTRIDLTFDKQVGDAPIQELIERVTAGYSIFFLSSLKQYLSPPLILIVWVYIVTSLFLRNGKAHLVIVTWILGTIAASVHFRGYAVPPPALAMHRSIVVIPIMVVSIAAWAYSHLYLDKLALKASLFTTVILVLSTFSVFYVVNGEFETPANRVHYVIGDLQEISRQQHVDMSKPLYIGIFLQNSDFSSLSDYLAYYAPYATVIQDSPQCLADVFSHHQGVFYFLPNHPCLDGMQTNKFHWSDLQINTSGMDDTYIKVISTNDYASSFQSAVSP